MPSQEFLRGYFLEKSLNLIRKKYPNLVGIIKQKITLQTQKTRNDNDMSSKKIQKTKQIGWKNESTTIINQPTTIIQQTIPEGYTLLNDESIEDKVKNRTFELNAAHGAEKIRLENEIAILKSRQANPEKAMQEELKFRATLKFSIKYYKNKVGAGKLAEAQEAIDGGNYSKTIEFFVKIQNKPELDENSSARASFTLGQIAEHEVRWKDAAKHYTRAAELNPSLVNLGIAHGLNIDIGDYDSALYFGKKATKVAKNEFGEESNEYAISLNNVGAVYKELGEYQKAESLYKESLNICRKTSKKDNLTVAVCLGNLGGVYSKLLKYEEVIPLLEESMEILKKTPNHRDIDIAKCTENLGAAYLQIDNNKKAEEIFNKSLQMKQSIFGENHPETATALHNLSDVYARQKRYKKAKIFCEKALYIRKKILGKKHLQTAGSLNNLGGIYQEQGQHKRAILFFKESLMIRKRALPEKHIDIANSYNNLALSYVHLKRYQKAKATYLPAIGIYEATLGHDHPKTKEAKKSDELIKKLIDMNP